MADLTAEPASDEPSPEDEYVAVAGLRVPAPLVPRIIAALRGSYPSLTAGITDHNAAVRAVLKFWITSTLTEWEGKQAQAPVGSAVQATLDEYAERARLARDRAESDAATITEAPLPPSPTP